MLAAVRHLLDPGQYALTPLAWPPLVAALLAATLGLVVLSRERASRVGLAFLAMTLTIFAWLFAFFWMYSAKEESTALTWARAAYVGVPLIAPSMYCFAASVLGLGAQRKLAVRAAWLTGAAFSVTIVTTDLLVAGVYHYSWGWYPRYGWLAAPFLAFFFGLMLETMRTLVVGFRSARPGVQRARIGALLVALGVAYVGSFDYVAKFGVPLYPFGYVPILGFLFLAARAVARYRLVDVTPALAADEIVRTMSDALLVLDEEGRVRGVNGAACALVGLPEAGIVGRSVSTLFEGCEEAYAELVARGELRDHEVHCRTPRGAADLSISASTLRGPAGHALARVVIARDMTERRRAEEQHKEIERLRAMDRMKTDFINTAAHELNTPLTPIRIQLHLLKQREAGAGGNGNHVQMLERNVERLSRLVEDILESARLQSQRLPMRKERFDLAAMVAESIEAFRDPFQAKGVALEADLADGTEVVGDPRRLTQVLLNLLQNAWKWTPAGGRVRVETVREGEHVLVRVRDDGHGLEPADAARLFQPFTQAHDPEAGPAGTGLGLYISKGIVDQHGGRIWCESDGRGKGTSFLFTVPLATAAEGVHAPGPEEAQRVGA